MVTSVYFFTNITCITICGFVLGSYKYNKDLYEKLFVFLLKDLLFFENLLEFYYCHYKKHSLTNSLPKWKEAAVLMYRENLPFSKCLSPRLIDLSLGSSSFFKINNNFSNHQTLPENFRANKVCQSVVIIYLLAPG